MLNLSKYSAGIITASDKGYLGEREDISGRVVKELLFQQGCEIKKQILLPDEQTMLENEMIFMTDVLKVDLILTTGGTGFSPRDCTPEATLKVATRLAPGIAEAIRHNSMLITKRAMLSRAQSVIRNNTLIINFPGSPKAVRESLEYIIGDLEHGLSVLAGNSEDCAK